MHAKKSNGPFETAGGSRAQGRCTLQLPGEIAYSVALVYGSKAMKRARLIA